jgi:thiol:disulfide interchange protein
MTKPKRERTKQEKDISFLIIATAMSLLIMSVIIQVAPYADFDNPQIKEIKAVESRMKSVAPKDLPYMLASTSSKPVMLVVYASWCTYCHKMMPYILDLMDENKLDHVSPIFLSIDSQPRLLSKYLVKHEFADRFPPFIIKQMIYNNMREVLKTTGSNFTGSIPYVGFFNTEGKAIAEISGLVDKQKFLFIANQFKK